MSIVPSSRIGKVEFYESHITAWTTSAAAIGLQPSAVATLESATKAAREAFTAAEIAREAAKSATQLFYTRVREMHNAPGMGSDMLDTIKTFALTTNNPDVYTLAQIPPPATPGTTPPPGTPFDFTVGLLQTGAIELKWKCNNPSGIGGTIYEVQRSINGGPATFVGSSGVKSFIDSTISGGPATYTVTAVRSTARGNPAVFTVYLGVGNGGGAGGFAITSVSGANGTQVKLAA